jgi:hypothetical protein
MLIVIDTRARINQKKTVSKKAIKKARISSSLTNGYIARKSHKAKTGQGWREPLLLVFQTYMHYLLYNITNCINRVAYMIDTIILTLTQNQFTITDPNKFEPSALSFINNDKQAPKGLKCKQNPTSHELALGLYKPRLTLFSRLIPFSGYKTLLKIEFSAPKLLLGNNFEELGFLLPEIFELFSFDHKLPL